MRMNSVGSQLKTEAWVINDSDSTASTTSAQSSSELYFGI